MRTIFGGSGNDILKRYAYQATRLCGFISILLPKKECVMLFFYCLSSSYDHLYYGSNL